MLTGTWKEGWDTVQGNDPTKTGWRWEEPLHMWSEVLPQLLEARPPSLSFLVSVLTKTNKQKYLIPLICSLTVTKISQIKGFLKRFLIIFCSN